MSDSSPAHLGIGPGRIPQFDQVAAEAAIRATEDFVRSSSPRPGRSVASMSAGWAPARADDRALNDGMRELLGVDDNSTAAEVLAALDRELASKRARAAAAGAPKPAPVRKAAVSAAPAVSAEDALYAAAFGKPAGRPAPLNAEDRLYEQAFGSSKVGA